MRRLLPLLTLLPCVALAAEPSDYAYGFALQLPQEGGAFQLELPPRVHEILVDPGLRDFEIFDASGRSVPLSAFRPLSLPQSIRVRLPVFSVHRVGDASAIDWKLHLQQRGVRELVIADRADAPRRTDHLLDARALQTPIEALHLFWTGGGNARFAVDVSDDLDRWRVLVDSTSVLKLQREDGLLQRRRIELPSTRAPYLRLRALDEGDLPQLGVEAELLSPSPPSRRDVEARLLQFSKESRGDVEVGVYEYELPGFFDVREVSVAPGESALLEVEVRSGEEERHRASFTAMRLEQPGEELSRISAEVAAAARSKRWVLRASPMPPTPPRFVAHAEPDRFVFLLQGEGPWTLAAGSHDARRQDAPLDSALEELRARRGAIWQPPEASVGERSELGGVAALQGPPAGMPWRTLLLWALLVVGALAVIALAFAVLRGERPRV